MRIESGVEEAEPHVSLLCVFWMRYADPGVNTGIERSGCSAKLLQDLGTRLIDKPLRCSDSSEGQTPLLDAATLSSRTHAKLNIN